MIADSLSNWRKYNLGKGFEKAFEYVESLKSGAPVGRFEIVGDKIYASIAEYSTSDSAPEFLEVHRKYIDLQITLSGRETLGWITNRNFNVKTPYDALKDCEFLQIPAKPLSLVEIDPASFAIFLPDDAHIGKLAASTGAEKIRKIVVKIAVELLGK